ncbi:MAG: beta-galactosidase [Clostridia bacterium]|nr:beta-galactosidase [Clostridia bacterium]
MKLSLDDGRLLPGTTKKDDTLILPPEGGGILLPELAGDGPRWLNATMTVLAGHAQAFELRVWGGEEEPRVTVRFGLMPGLRAAVALDLNWLDGHVLFPGHRVGTQKVVCHGSRIDRAEIRRAALVSMACFEPVSVRVESLSLDDAPCAVQPPCGEKLIDAFGQYAPKEWPGKIRSEEELAAALRAEAAKPAAYPFPSWTKWGGCADRKLAPGTGFFSRARRDERWYLTDPEGCAFFSMGPDCVVARADARIDGLENLLDGLPPRDAAHAFLYESPRRAFGETERGEPVMFSYERANLARAFGDRWEESWRRMVVGQLMRMGMNTLGNWSDEKLFGSMPYVASLPRFPETACAVFRDFPDVFSPEYEEDAARCAQALASRRDDPWMIGYFLRNEPQWAFVNGLIIAEEVLRNPRDTACRRALIDWLRARYGTAEALSAAWAHRFESFDALMTPIERASRFSGRAREDLRAFSALLTERYVRVPAEACRRVDPNHMILGMRWAWISDPLLVSGWKCFDVFSINCYAVDPTNAIERVRELGVDLPVMIGEFHFGALDAGLPATGLEAVRDQADRGRAYRYYCERVAAHPNGVGCHWFQCYDQFALGRFDGENYNIGLFDIALRPYDEMAAAVCAASEAVYAVKAGERVPFCERPESLPMIAY